jgi:hypothetical protein
MIFTDDDSKQQQQIFSDADLKRVKAELASARKMEWPFPDAEALLARLEAAEISDAWARAGHTQDCKGGFHCTCPFMKSREAWRRAKGLSDSEEAAGK